MTLARWVAGKPRALPMVAIAVFISIAQVWATAGRWDSEGAAKAFQQARQKKSELTQNSAAGIEQYLACARMYRTVHQKDPHYGRTGDAIFEEGLLYQEIGDKFQKPEYHETAIRRFQLLVRDYGGNLSCPEALLRIGIIYSTRLNKERAALDAHRRLRSQYGYSDAAIQKMRARLISEDPASARANDGQVGAGLQATVQNVRFWSFGEQTRVTIDVDRAVRYDNARLSNPDRVYFDISGSRLSSQLVNRTFTIGDGILKDIRVSPKTPDVVRLVLDLSKMSYFSVHELRDPFRIVIDLHRDAQTAPDKAGTDLAAAAGEDKSPENGSVRLPPKAITNLPEIPSKPVAGKITPGTLPKSQDKKSAGVPAAPAATASGPASSLPSTPPAKEAARPTPTAKPEAVSNAQPSMPTSRGDRTLTRILGLKVGRIVIDPGHGGHDYGTIGPKGLAEKNLVLSLAKSLQRMIEDKLGAEVILTRNDDSFISLDERTAIANQHRADLFISLHANSSRIRSISGVETYYLDFAKTDAEREIAARENATTVSNVSDLEDLIKKIAKADKSAESRELATIVQEKLYGGARRVIRSTQNRGVRSAPFIVLIGANMPSVLAEVGFISNPKDERLLGKDSTRQQIVRALFSGVQKYVMTLGSNLVQNNQ